MELKNCSTVNSALLVLCLGQEHKCTPVVMLQQVYDIYPRFVLQESEVNAEGAVGDELAERFQTITNRLQSLKLETDEVGYLQHFPL